MADEFLKITKRAEKKAGPGHLLTRSEVFGSGWEDLLKDEAWKDQIPGGKADKCVPSCFDQEQLLRGAHIELEHTRDKRKALEIAMDHLLESKNYYRKLEVVDPEDFEEMDK